MVEALNILLRKTLATSTPDEVAFIYVPKERINKRVYMERFGSAEVQDDGVTYSLTKEKLMFCFRSGTQTISKLGSWALDVTPCTGRTMTSVALPSSLVHAMEDLVTAIYIPERAAGTVGMTVVHFYSEEEADTFIQRLSSGGEK